MMKHLSKKIIRHLRSKKGQGLVEYLFILLLIAVVVISSLAPLGPVLSEKFAEFAAAVSGN